MKRQSIIILSLAVGSLSFTACNDFLDREPLSSVTSEHYLNTEAELASFGAAQYDALPAHKPGEYSIGVFKTDNNSDKQKKITSFPANAAYRPAENGTSRRYATATISLKPYCLNTKMERSAA